MKTILIADDKANIRNLVREYLEAEGFRAVIAADGREALYTFVFKAFVGAGGPKFVFFGRIKRFTDYPIWCKILPA
jgi:hypothetical protein